MQLLLVYSMLLLGAVRVAVNVSAEELQCHQAQGYLYSRPVPAEMVPELLRHELPLEKQNDH